MIAPERFDHMPLLISKLQRDSIEMHQCTMAKVCCPNWKFGLFCNVNKFPLEPATHSECIEVGLRMSWQDFLHIGRRGFMDNLVAMNPPKKKKEP